MISSVHACVDLLYCHQSCTVWPISFGMQEGMSALMWAARKKKQADVVSKFISAGADVNLKNREVYAADIL